MKKASDRFQTVLHKTVFHTIILCKIHAARSLAVLAFEKNMAEISDINKWTRFHLTGNRYMQQIKWHIITAKYPPTPNYRPNIMCLSMTLDEKWI